MPIITLTTDFGYRDPYVGAVKGSILRELPEATIVDISHQIDPFNIQDCAYTLKNAYTAFPEGSVHIVGVDSELSPENQHIAVQADGHYFVTANNGVMSLITSEVKPEEVVEIELPNIRPGSFPVQQVFVQAACHIARGGKLEVLGKPFDQLRDVREFEARIGNDGRTISGNVIYIDNYGNVVTNIHKSLFEAYRNGRSYEILARTTKLREVHQRYNGIINYNLERGQRKGAGDALALFNSSGFMELAIYKSDLVSVGGASTLLGLKYRDLITVNFI